MARLEGAWADADERVEGVSRGSRPWFAVVSIRCGLCGENWLWENLTLSQAVRSVVCSSVKALDHHFPAGGDEDAAGPVVAVNTGLGRVEMFSTPLFF